MSITSGLNAQPTPEVIVDETADASTTIDTLRGQIDALDTAIARLVAERAQLSRRIQTARINAGGTRIELGRERAIIDHYRSALGSEGASVGEAVLRACRGAR
ncbi:chorismate mutase [Jatrophihabitans telluris]|uniref:Chorismate mutase n=1 Tax=Jatrophihabitans telluris TaxID=2038343 RepID=A0ABY4QWF0_9ACTN|nr:chorismate mutase [Jatrophihabitans telluris]UQX87860.1 chorismate mutase [Jatrophihabitans telluris]